MRDQITVDIHHDPGVTLRASTALEIADRHGVRDQVEQLLPYTVYGKGYVRGVHIELAMSLRLLRDDRVEEGMLRVTEALRCVPRTWTAVPRPLTTSGAAAKDVIADAPRVRAPDRADGAKPPPTGKHRSTDPAGPAPGQPSVHTVEASGPPEFAQATLWDDEAAHTAGLVNVHSYGPASAAKLAASYALGAKDQAMPSTDAAYFLSGSRAVTRATWRQHLRTAASAGTVTVIAVSDPGQHDDRRWRSAASRVADALARDASWVAIRRTDPHSILLFTTSRRPLPVALRHLAAVATPPLRRGPVTGPRPHGGNPVARPPTSAPAAVSGHTTNQVDPQARRRTR